MSSKTTMRYGRDAQLQLIVVLGNVDVAVLGHPDVAADVPCV